MFCCFCEFLVQFICDHGACNSVEISETHKNNKTWLLEKDAMRREHLPKDKFLLLLDTIAVIPFVLLLNPEECQPSSVWPNILGFLEFLVIYRLVQYFSLCETHSFWNLLFGFVLVALIVLNALTSLLVLLTFNGLCDKCTEYVLDWRTIIISKLQGSDGLYATHVYGAAFINTFLISVFQDFMQPGTYYGYFISILILICGFILTSFFIIPKLFSEALLRHQQTYNHAKAVNKIVHETSRRNKSMNVHKKVKDFYLYSWKKNNGYPWRKKLMLQFPKYLRLYIKEDLVWPVFYHSPCLRNTSESLKRWLSEFINLEFKIPGEYLYSGSSLCLCYLKSGIVQILSSDDGITPVLSVTQGTIFGDISFYTPALKRKVDIKCLTYCEVFFVSRENILRALHRFPKDRKEVMRKAKERLSHALILHSTQQNDDSSLNSKDGLDWFKKRWWELFSLVKKFEIHKAAANIQIKEMLSEDDKHCIKYIGLSVLCSLNKLQINSLFFNDKFPLILLSDSCLTRFWKGLVYFTVMLVLVSYPLIISENKINMFYYLIFWVDVTYCFDIIIDLITVSVEKEEVTTSIISVMFNRCKQPMFYVDLLSALWLEYFVVAFGYPKYYRIGFYNRLLKIHILFSDKNIKSRIFQSDFFYTINIKLFLVIFSYAYIVAFVLYDLAKYFPDIINVNLLFCIENTFICNISIKDVFITFLSWLLSTKLNIINVTTLYDIYLMNFIQFFGLIITLYIKATVLATLYIKYRDIIYYRHFAKHFVQYFKNLNLNSELMARLNTYLVFHWKYYHGVEILKPNQLIEEPFDVYWIAHGKKARTVIGESKAFVGADHKLIKELSLKSNFILLPQGSKINSSGHQSKNIFWLVQGHIESFQYNEDGMKQGIFPQGEMISCHTAFMNSSAYMTLICSTDCEFLTIEGNNFFYIMHMFPDDWLKIHNCVKEFKPQFKPIPSELVAGSKFELLRRTTLNSDKNTNTKLLTSKNIPQQKIDINNIGPFKINIRFIHLWLIFRAAVVFVSILSSSIEGSIGASVRRPLRTIGIVCNVVAVVDIFFKLFLPYYCENGILVTSPRKCVVNYVSRGFFLDCVGAIPWCQFLRVIEYPVNEQDAIIANSVFKYAHSYLLLGCIYYFADSPTSNVTYLMISKCILFGILITSSISQYVFEGCVKLTWDQDLNLSNVHLVNDSWCPHNIISYFKRNSKDMDEILVKIFAESVYIAQSGLMKIAIGTFIILFKINIEYWLVISTFGVVFWFFVSCTIIMLVLQNREKVSYKYNVMKLKTFLKNERVPESLIKSTEWHLKYWWERTRGNKNTFFQNKCIEDLFMQDINYFLYQSTYHALALELGCSNKFERNLAGAGRQIFYLPGEEIIREKELNPWVYIIDKGQVVVERDRMHLAILSKGEIFGQITGHTPRPVLVSVRAVEHTDVMQISSASFQEFFQKENKTHLQHHPDWQKDFFKLPNVVPEDPYNTVKYLLQKRKKIKFSKTKKTLDALEDTVYSWWLFLAWLVEPLISATLVLLVFILPSHMMHIFDYVFLVLDIIHLGHIIIELYSVEITIEKRKCVEKLDLKQNLKKITMYVDLASLILPQLIFITGEYKFHLARLIRLRLIYNFHQLFCEHFEAKLSPLIINFTVGFLLIHAVTCGYVFVVCRENLTSEKVFNNILNESIFKSSINFEQWTQNRKFGCLRVTYVADEDSIFTTLVVPKYWLADYLFAVSYLLMLTSETRLQLSTIHNIPGMIYKILISFVLYALRTWIIGVAISTVYTKYYDLYEQDGKMRNLLTYLKCIGITPFLLKSLEKYSRQLWMRQRGNSLPMLANKINSGLRHDIMWSLYSHHVTKIKIFKDLPEYFLRQLVARMKKMVVFPDKCIVKQGDITPNIYFVHEGDVESWVNDEISGESKLVSHLTANCYFGLLQSLFPSIPHPYSYYSRSVVDLMTLEMPHWKDLLQGYPNISQQIYERVKKEHKISV